MKTPGKNLVLTLCLLAVCLASSCLKDDTEDLPTLLELLEERSQFSTFIDLVEDSDLMGQMDGELNMTIFPPTDQAFQAYFDENSLTDINDIPKDTRENLLSYHIQLGVAATENILTNYYTSPTNAGPEESSLSLFIASDGIRVELNDKATVTLNDLRARNGYMHGIDSVLIFPTAIELLRMGGVHTTFLDGLERTDLLGLVDGVNPYTLLAPTDDAFEEYFAATQGVDSFDDMSQQRLREVMRYHLIVGNRRAESFTGGDVQTLNDNETVEVIPFDSRITFNGFTNSIIVNIQGTNGVVHMIDRVLIPN